MVMSWQLGKSRVYFLLLSALPGAAVAGDGVWTSTGPAAQITAIAIGQQDTLAVIAAGKPTGGAQEAVFTMTDSSQWVERAEASDGVTITSLAVDPSNRSTVFATSQVFGDTVAGALYVTRDGGISWSFLHLFENSPIFALAVDPSRPMTLYAGGYSGAQNAAAALFRSSDGGQTWVSLPMPSIPAYVITLAIDSKRPDHLYAGTTCGLFSSGDSGETWVARYGVQSCTPIYTVVVDPTEPASAYLGFFEHFYAFFFDGGIAKTTDDGQSWARLSLQAPVVSIALDPVNPGILYAGTALGFGVFGTRDGGATWSAVGQLLGTGAIVLDPAAEKIYEATDNGVFEYGITLRPPVVVPNDQRPRTVPSRP
jgi:photosystem II stability/assembly factor-like uncharacterized protein